MIKYAHPWKYCHLFELKAVSVIPTLLQMQFTVTAQMQQQQIMQNTELPTNVSSYKASEGSDLKILRAGLFLVITKNKTH